MLNNHKLLLKIWPSHKSCHYLRYKVSYSVCKTNIWWRWIGVLDIEMDIKLKDHAWSMPVILNFSERN